MTLITNQKKNKADKKLTGMKKTPPQKLKETAGGVFMLRLVSVEPGLESVKSYLDQQGYEVSDMDTCNRAVEAVVYSGQSLQSGAKRQCSAAQNTVLVNAAGLTPEEVAIELENKLN
jgi:hypothetical protein